MRYDKKSISSGQIKKIRALANALGLIDGTDDSAYRDMLKSWSVASVKDLSFSTAGALIDKLEKNAIQMNRWEKRIPQNEDKYSDCEGREGMASAAQIRAIEGLWNDVSFAEDKKAALRQFIDGKFGISFLEWLDLSTAEKVIKTLQTMKKTGKKKKGGSK